MLAWGEIVDMLVRDDESVVLTADQCFRLTAVPTRTLDFLRTPRSRAGLEAHLAAVFGEAPDGAVDSLLDELLSQRLLRIKSDDRTDDALTNS